MESKEYLELDLPSYLDESLKNMKNGLQKLENGEKYTFIDCDYCALQANINCAEVDNEISSECAWYLREKYLGFSLKDIESF